MILLIFSTNSMKYIWDLRKPTRVKNNNNKIFFSYEFTSKSKYHLHISIFLRYSTVLEILRSTALEDEVTQQVYDVEITLYDVNAT